MVHILLLFPYKFIATGQTELKDNLHARDRKRHCVKGHRVKGLPCSYISASNVQNERSSHTRELNVSSCFKVSPGSKATNRRIYRGIGLQISRLLLQNTGLKVVATSRKPEEARKAILDGLNKGEDRLTTLEVDCLKEDSIAEAAKAVKSKHGDHSLRLLLNISGVVCLSDLFTYKYYFLNFLLTYLTFQQLFPEKAVEKVDAQDILKSFQVNTFGHLLTYKHFVPLLPSSKGKDGNEFTQDNDPGKPYLPSKLSVVGSLTARVGSIGDNAAGGWYSYRSSKAATNQIIKTLNQQLTLKSISAIALALHPGTTAFTGISKGFVKEEDVNNKRGVHDAPTAAKHVSRAFDYDSGQTFFRIFHHSSFISLFREFLRKTYIYLNHSQILIPLPLATAS